MFSNNKNNNNNFDFNFNNNQNQTPMYLVLLSFMQKEGLPKELIQNFIEHIENNKQLQKVITSDGGLKEMNLAQSQLQNEKIGVDVEFLLENFEKVIKFQTNQNLMLNNSNNAQLLRPEVAKNLETKIKDKFLNYLKQNLNEVNPPNFRHQLLKSQPKHKLVKNKKNTFQLSNLIHFRKLKNIMGHAYSQSSGNVNSENEEPFIPVQALTYDKSGQFIFSADSEGLIKVFSSQTGLLLNNFKGHTKAIYVIEISPCNRFLVSCSSDVTARIWDFYDGRPLAVLKGESDDPFGSGNWFKIENQLFLVISSDKGYVYIYREEDFINNLGVINDQQYCLKLKMPWKPRLVNGKLVNQDKNEVYNIQMHPQGYLTICLESGEIYVYEKLQNFHKNQPEGRRSIKKYDYVILDQHLDCCKVVSWNPSGDTLISASKDGTCKFWKWNSRSLNDNKKLQSDFSIELSDEQILFKSENKHKKNFYSSECSSIAWSIKGSYVIITFYKQPKKNNDYNDIFSFMCIYSMREKKILHWLNSENTPLHFTDVIWILEPHPLREEIVLSADESGQIAIWDVQMGVLLNTFQEKGYAMKWPQLDLPILDARFNPNGQQFAVCTSFGTLSIYGLGNSDFFKICPTEQFFASDTEPFAVQENLRITTIEVEDTDVYEMDRGRICDQEREPYIFEYRNLIPKLQFDGYFDTDLKIKNIKNPQFLPEHIKKEEADFYKTTKREIMKNKEKDLVYEKEMLFYHIQRKAYILRQINNLKSVCNKTLAEHKILAKVKLEELSQKDKEYLKSYQNEVQMQEEQNNNNNQNQNNNQNGQRRHGRSRNRLVRLGSQGQINAQNSQNFIGDNFEEEYERNILEDDQDNLNPIFQYESNYIQQQNEEDELKRQIVQRQQAQHQFTNIRRTTQQSRVQQQNVINDEEENIDFLKEVSLSNKNDSDSESEKNHSDSFSSEVINTTTKSRRRNNVDSDEIQTKNNNYNSNNNNQTRSTRNQRSKLRNQQQNQQQQQQRNRQRGSKKKVIDSDDELEEEKEFVISDKDISEEFDEDDMVLGDELEELEDEDGFSQDYDTILGKSSRQKSQKTRQTRASQRTGQRKSGGKYSNMQNYYDSDDNSDQEEYNSSRLKRKQKKNQKKNRIYSNDEESEQDQEFDVEETSQSQRKTRGSQIKQQNQQTLKRKKNMAIDSDDDEEQSTHKSQKQKKKLKTENQDEDEDQEDEIQDSKKPSLRKQKSQQQNQVNECLRCELAFQSQPGQVQKEHQNDKIVRCKTCQNGYHMSKCARLRGVFKDSSEYYCFNCRAQKDMNKREDSRILRTGYKRDHLNSPVHDIYRLLPQLGEQVYFIMQGYEEFLAENFEILSYKTLKKKYMSMLGEDQMSDLDIIMPIQRYKQLSEATLCTIEELTYEFPSVQRKYSEKYPNPPIFMLLKLRICDENYNNQKQQQNQENQNSFYVYYYLPSMDMKANFLIHKQQFNDGLQRFQAIQKDESIYCGQDSLSYQVKDFKNYDAAFPKSDYMRIIIEPINDYTKKKSNLNNQRHNTRHEQNQSLEQQDLTHISPWDIEQSYLQYYIGDCFNQDAIDSIIDLLNSLKKHRQEEYLIFEEKVDTKVYKDYLQNIEVPIEVSTIFNRVKNKYYRSKKQALHDIQLIKQNAQEYNAEESEIYKTAGEFAEILTGIFTNYTDYDKVLPKLFASEQDYEEYMGFDRKKSPQDQNQEKKSKNKSKKKQQTYQQQLKSQNEQSQNSENSQKLENQQQKQNTQDESETKRGRRTRQLQKPNYKEQDENNIPYRESNKRNKSHKLSNTSSHNLINNSQINEEKQNIKQQILIKKNAQKNSSSNQNQQQQNKKQFKYDSNGNLSSSNNLNNLTNEELTVEELQKKLDRLQSLEIDSNNNNNNNNNNNVNLPIFENKIQNQNYIQQNSQVDQQLNNQQYDEQYNNGQMQHQNMDNYKNYNDGGFNQYNQQHNVPNYINPNYENSNSYIPSVINNDANNYNSNFQQNGQSNIGIQSQFSGYLDEEQHSSQYQIYNNYDQIQQNNNSQQQQQQQIYDDDIQNDTNSNIQPIANNINNNNINYSVQYGNGNGMVYRQEGGIIGELNTSRFSSTKR